MCAENGTLFLDEIGDMPMHVQSALLRALEYKQIRALGSDRFQKIEFRLVAATNKDLRMEIASGKFRGDLYSRLTGLTIDMPQLWQRVEDIPLLVSHFLELLSEEYGKGLIFSDNALEKLGSISQRFNGNVRDLKHFVERAAVFSEGGVIDVNNYVFTGKMPATSTVPVQIGQMVSEDRTLNLDSIKRAVLKLDPFNLRPKFKPRGFAQRLSNLMNFPLNQIYEFLLNKRYDPNKIIDECRIEIVQKLLNEDLSIPAIAKRLDVNYDTIYKLVKKYELRKQS